MFIILPEWIHHQNEKNKNTPIYSISVHPILQKLATGGQDQKIKIWNTLPILNSALENDSSVAKLLSTLSLHNGAILCVRWSNGNGRFLASGSDDTKIVIWELAPSNDQKPIFGDLEGNINSETYKPFKVLMGHHQSDVSDLAWSPDNTFLASASFDSNIIIWDGSTFENLKIIKGHSGFVKGLTWDPVCKYLASQSDDKSVKIWRTSDWVMEEEITNPYEHSATVTFFRRLSWSPEGSCIVTANGENSGLCTAPIISRDGWNADVYLVGHQGPIEVAAFNPLLFEMPTTDSNGNSSKTISAICAVASQDNSISVWWTSKARSAAVANNLFNYSILDMCWTPDGQALFACSYDGTVASLAFEPLEFGIPLAADEKDQALAKYGYQKRKNMALESVEQLILEEESLIEQVSTGNRAVTSTIGFNNPPLKSTPQTLPISSITSISSLKSISTANQKTSITKDGKKRIQPIFLSGSSFNENRDVVSNIIKSNEISLDIPVSFSSEKRKLNVNSAESDIYASANKKNSGMAGTHHIKPTQYILPTWIDTKPPVNLGIPVVEQKGVKNIIISSDPIEELSLEFSNSKLSRVTCRREETQLWTDIVSGSIIQITGSHKFFAVSTIDGKVYVYSMGGRRILPVLILESAITFLESCNEYLMYITSSGNVCVWNIEKEESIISSGIGHLLRPGSNDDYKGIITIVSAHILETGVPKITTSSQDVFAYHKNLRTWMRVSDSKTVRFQAETGIVTSLNSIKCENGVLLNLSELENQLACALYSNSAVEYRYWMKLYARRLADENAILKIEEISKMLLGPSRLGQSENSEWNPMIMNVINKRELLKELLPIFAKNRMLQRIIQSVDGALRMIEK